MIEVESESPQHVAVLAADLASSAKRWVGQGAPSPQPCSDSCSRHRPHSLTLLDRACRRPKRLPSPTSSPPIPYERIFQNLPRDEIGADKPIAHSTTHAQSGSGATTSKRVKLYPSLAIQAHKKGYDPEARLWAFIRSKDLAGKGHFCMAELQSITADFLSWVRVCQILRKGSGKFWTLESDSLRMRRPDNVLEALQGYRSPLSPVFVECEALNTMASYRAAVLYDGFLAGRNRSKNPITRATIRQETGVTESTQRNYQKARRIGSELAVGIIARFDKELFEDLAWKCGRRIFRFVDYRGYHGPPGQAYIAQRLGNEYRPSVEPVRGRRWWDQQKRLPKCPSRVKQARVAGIRRLIYHERADSAWRAFSRTGDTDEPVFHRARPSEAVKQAASCPRIQEGVSVHIRVPLMERNK